MTTHLHDLKGCAPAPLAYYLKALGILRLVGEQADPQARGWWDGERFCLLTKLSKEELETFFLEKYEPTPLVAPWNGGSGFFKKDNRKAITAIRNTKAPRFAPFHRAIDEGDGVLNGLTAKPDKKQKWLIQREAVLRWRGTHHDWLRAAFVLDEHNEPTYPSLLGTGGNDGRLDFTNNFMQQLCALFDMSDPLGRATDSAHELLKEAFWTAPSQKLQASSIGQFQPGSAGGANSSTGFESGNLINPWDFVLMLEGAILFSSRVTRRLDPNAFSKASAPFAVQSHAAGFATPGDEKAQRGEQWMPLWRQPATIQDVATLLGEARLQLHRQTVYRPIDAARAISRLGVARGISEFVRYGYLERNGQSTLAVPLGRVHVRYHPRSYLIDDLAAWLDRLQRLSRDKNAPARLVHAERRLADAVFAALTHDYSPERWQAILLAAAEIEALQATGTGIEAGVLGGLRPEWVAAVNDGSPEFRLALALGSAAASYRNHKPSDPIRHHFLPLERGARKFRILDKELASDPRVVVSGRDPIRDLAAIVERRLIEAAQRGERRCRLVAADGCGAQLDDLARFLSGAVDLDRLFGLGRAFMAIRWDRWALEHRPKASPAGERPEECWLAVRLCCLPFAIDDNHDIPADERVVRLLMSGDAARAIEIARRRLRSVGIRPPMYAGTTDAETARRWAAALAFPIHRSTAQRAAAILDPSMKGLTHA
ncbi:MAG: type I-U CRISPR-associated protein Csx17 [Gemmataceae bacterium]|nr:type I-U CRISPR-associated protein Csx17 [Gemmataceae bacterium]